MLTTSGSETSGTLNTEHKFGGQTFDTSTDMYFYGGRYYDRTLRRFISAEGYMPAFNAPQTLNRYSFGGNNPLSPTGDVASFSGVAVARYKPSNHNGLPVSSSNPGGTKAVSQENSGSANQGFAWQMAMLNLHSQGQNPNIVDDVPTTKQNQGTVVANASQTVSYKAASSNDNGFEFKLAERGRRISTLAPGTTIIGESTSGIAYRILIHNPMDFDPINTTMSFSSHGSVNVRIRAGFVPFGMGAWNPSQHEIWTGEPGAMSIGLLVHEAGHVFDRLSKGTFEFSAKYIFGLFTSFNEEAEEFANGFSDVYSKPGERKPTHFWILEPKKK